MLTPPTPRRYHPRVETSSDRLPISTARHVAKLARLALDDSALEQHRKDLSAILGYIESLRELNLEGVEPLSHPLDSMNRPDADTPLPGLPTEALMRLAPAADPPFVSVPKVLDGGE